MTFSRIFTATLSSVGIRTLKIDRKDTGPYYLFQPLQLHCSLCGASPPVEGMYISFYESLVKADTANGQFWYRRAFRYGQVYHSTRNQQAIDGYKKAIFYDFKPADSYFHLSTCYLIVDDSTAAVYLKESLRLDPTNQDARILLAGAQDRLEMEKKDEKSQ